MPLLEHLHILCRWQDMTSMWSFAKDSIYWMMIRASDHHKLKRVLNGSRTLRRTNLNRPQQTWMPCLDTCLKTLCTRNTEQMQNFFVFLCAYYSHRIYVKEMFFRNHVPLQWFQCPFISCSCCDVSHLPSVETNGIAALDRTNLSRWLSFESNASNIASKKKTAGNIQENGL